MTEIIQLVEQHIISRHDPRFAAIDAACWLSKNLYNRANYLVRQQFFAKGEYITNSKLDKQMQQEPDYTALPRKVSQQVLRQLNQAWQDFFAAQAEYQAHPERFTGRPRLPHYKDIQGGRNMLIYTIQAINRKRLRQGKIKPSQLEIEISTHLKPKQIDQVRILPRASHYLVEVVYTTPIIRVDLDPHLIAAIDIGVNNLAAVTSNKPGFVPFLVNGRPLKAINQFYNKERARMQAEMRGKCFTSHRLQRLTDKRNRKIKHELHQISRRLILALASAGIGTLVIGKNVGWKQSVEMGKRNNQNFVGIPHDQFIEMLTYKAEKIGMKVCLVEESYTSKCSFLDNEPLEERDHYVGQRIKRGMFRSSTGRLINADVNGSYNILRKVAPKSFTRYGVEGVVVRPVSYTL